MYKKVGIASLIMMSSVFLSRIIGLCREMVIAFVGGVSGGVDAYQIAFALPEILNHFVAGGFLSVTFIPIFAKYITHEDEAAGWHVFSTVLTGIGIVALFLIVLGEIYTEPLVGILAPGVDDPAIRAQVVKMTRIILPAQFFFFAGGLFMAVQFAKERFFIPALAPLIYNIGIITGGLCLGRLYGMEGLSWGVLAGAFLGNFCLQYVGARRVGMQYRPAFGWAHPDFKHYILLTLPLMVGLTPAFSIEIFFRFFGSFLPTGSVAGINYAKVIMFVLVGLFGQAVGTAIFPYLSRLMAEKNFSEVNRLLNHTLRYLSLAIPLVVLLIVLRREIVVVLFQRGQFDTAATTLTAQVLAYVLPGAVAMAAYTLIIRGFYAMQDTVFPAIFGTLAVVLSLPIYFFGMHSWGARGIALAMSVSLLFQAILIYGLWNRRSHNTESLGVYRCFAKMTGIGLLMGFLLVVFKWVAALGIDATSMAGALTTAAVIGLLFISILLGVGFGFRVPEIVEPAEQIWDRFKNRKT
ncbi:MAG: murein biosynthesis integral membrane protein MurJ [Deltaproteobacteria bacterium]|nr:murein biosynthesis integral membrane protein MurJ [Deltaproteobacteria bacterium]